MTWIAEDILHQFDFPRENATDGLARGQAVLDSLLNSAQIVPTHEAFQSSPHRLTAASICLLLVVLGLGMGCISRQLRWRIVALLGIGLAVVFASGGFDVLLPHAPASNVLVEIAPSGVETRRVMLSAHYDSKTELFDHVVRSAIVASLVLLVPLAFWAQFRQRATRRRLTLTLPALVASSLVAMHFLAALVVPDRSHGIRDNAAACAVLLELCSRAAHQPLENTRLQFAWWAAEEIGAQGSAVWVQRHPTDLPDAVVNLEAIGSGSDLAIGGLEWTGRSWKRPSEHLARTLQAVATRDLHRLRAPLLTDAGPFLGHGVHAITVLNLTGDSKWPRALHSKADRMDSLHPAGLDAVRTLILDYVLHVDAIAPTEAQTQH